VVGHLLEVAQKLEARAALALGLVVVTIANQSPCNAIAFQAV
jgi:hypothetical protein